MGSRDRKIVSELVYSFYRLGHSGSGISLENKLLLGLFVCGNANNELLTYFRPEWDENIRLRFDEKEIFLKDEGSSWQSAAIFPWQDDLSAGINHEAFNISHLRQPDLFLRVRPGKETGVSQKLNSAGITFTSLSNNCLVLPNASKVDQVLSVDEEIVIQDFNSQRVGDFFKVNTESKVSVWDCCAGSGGKSIMAYDLNPAMNLYVSDSRVSIIQNLSQRFEKAGIDNYHSFVTDLTSAQSSLNSRQYDYIIADVPCSGSGTWSRTPEQLYFFDHKRIEYYSDLQKDIISHVIPKLKAGGRLTYITCSVFKAENEDVVEFIQSKFGLKLEVMELLKGYKMKADSLFVTTFVKG